MCAQPSGEVCARSSGGTSSPSFRRSGDRVADIPVDDDGSEQVEAGDPVMLAFLGAVMDFTGFR